MGVILTALLWPPLPPPLRSRWFLGGLLLELWTRARQASVPGRASRRPAVLAQSRPATAAQPSWAPLWVHCPAASRLTASGAPCPWHVPSPPQPAAQVASEVSPVT